MKKYNLALSSVWTLIYGLNLETVAAANLYIEHPKYFSFKNENIFTLVCIFLNYTFLF